MNRYVARLEVAELLSSMAGSKLQERSKNRNEDGFARKEQDGANLANFKVRAPENCQ